MAELAVEDERRGEHPLVLFDGTCNLCHGAVQFIIRRDSQARFRFASLQSPAAARLLASLARSEPLPDSMVLLTRDGRVHLHSGAALRIARRLRFPWFLAAVFLVVPPLLRDALYRWIARNRHRWFGRRDACLLPTADLRARFLDDGG